MKKLLKWLLRLLPVAYMIFVFILSSLPSNAVVELPDSTIDAFIKESLHLVEFAILYGLLVLAVFTTGKFSYKWNVFCAVISILYGLSDEIHQSFMPYRSATLIDFIKDTIGVLVAYYFVYRWHSKKRFNRVLHFFRESWSIS